MLYVIILLIITVLFLSARLFLIKKELKRIASAIKDNPGHDQMNMDLVDRDLQKTVAGINDLYSEIMKIQAEGRSAEKELKESVSVISHDMRTPLTSIIGYLQVASRSEDPGETKESINIALERAYYLNDLVNDFFELSLLESGKVDIKTADVNLSEMICEEILAESPQIDKKGLVPLFRQQDEDHIVKADAQMLTRVIQNLISNAVKYSEHRLEFDIKEREDNKTLLTITTDASGKIDTDRIFDRFYQNDSSRTKGGAGLGLYICKNFVEMMDGTIEAKQEGSSFEILLTLPRA